MTALADRLQDNAARSSRRSRRSSCSSTSSSSSRSRRSRASSRRDPTWTRLVEGLAILTVLWWAWESYVWLGNTAGSDEGTVRVVLLSAMGGDADRVAGRPARIRRRRGHLRRRLLAVRALHIGAYAIVSREDPQLRPWSSDGDHHAAGLSADRRGRRAGRHRAGRSCGRRRWPSTTAGWSCAAPRAGASWPATSPSATA